MAIENRLWGAERIRGELLKLGIRIAKRTVQRYMRSTGPGAPRPGQRWGTFLRNHTVWACDFLQSYDIWFRPIFGFFIVDVNAKRVVHVGVTRAPTQAWTEGRVARRRRAIHRRAPLRRLRHSAPGRVARPARWTVAVARAQGVLGVAPRVAGKMRGDVDFDAVRQVASFITPVPRGGGPATVAALCENLFRAAQLAAGVAQAGYSLQ